jgi:hypothetical protein
VGIKILRWPVTDSLKLLRLRSGAGAACMRSWHHGSSWLKVTGRPYDVFWARLAAVTMFLRLRRDLPAPIRHELRGDAAPLSLYPEVFQIWHVFSSGGAGTPRGADPYLYREAANIARRMSRRRCVCRVSRATFPGRSGPTTRRAILHSPPSCCSCSRPS